MKRSEINAIMRDADAFMKANGFRLPPFAYWSPADWAGKGDEAREIVDRQLGWDITDFGLGDYEHTGLFIFTIRNGNPADLPKGGGKLYAEKVLISDVDQVTPFHFHWRKVEDIINRGGGKLVIQLYNSTEGDELAESESQREHRWRTADRAGRRQGRAGARREHHSTDPSLPRLLGRGETGADRRGLAG